VGFKFNFFKTPGVLQCTSILDTGQRVSVREGVSYAGGVSVREGVSYAGGRRTFTQ